jgi:hypothetical protein
MRVESNELAGKNGALHRLRRQSGFAAGFGVKKDRVETPRGDFGLSFQSLAPIFPAFAHGLETV